MWALSPWRVLEAQCQWRGRLECYSGCAANVWENPENLPHACVQSTQSIHELANLAELERTFPGSPNTDAGQDFQLLHTPALLSNWKLPAFSSVCCLTGTDYSISSTQISISYTPGHWL